MNTTERPTELAAAPEPPPEWLEDIIDAIGITDGIDIVKWHQDKDGDYIVQIEYGEEEMSFTAGTDGEHHGADYEGTIHDMTAPSDVQWWCAGKLYMRLQRAKRRLKDLEASDDPSTQNRSPNTMSKNQTESKPQSVEEPQEEGLDETACSVSYLEGALAKAKTWSIHNSPYAHHSPEYNDWLRGYADYPDKFSSLNA